MVMIAIEISLAAAPALLSSPLLSSPAPYIFKAIHLSHHPLPPCYSHPPFQHPCTYFHCLDLTQWLAGVWRRQTPPARGETNRTEDEVSGWDATGLGLRVGDCEEKQRLTAADKEAAKAKKGRKEVRLGLGWVLTEERSMNA
ncbi:uncharacterized protein IWZ02DRAFT_435635 [Phyllosticta citriasiana]|uniref:uncharacterized protein n=1 Tax=Phyllosticta citriasiana TaxID=595635 RepID=UPI0030FD5E79